MINANKAKQDREVTDDVREKPATIVPFAPMPKAQVDSNIVVDDSGRAIVALLQKAAEMAKDDCARPQAFVSTARRGRNGQEA